MYSQYSMKQFFSFNLDSIGFFASTICAVHCMAVPMLLTISTWGGLQILNDPSIEWTVLSISALLALFSLVPSYFRHHKRLKAILLVAGGFMLIGIGRLETDQVFEIVFTSTGAATVGFAHYINWRLFRNCPVHRQKDDL